MTADGAAQMNVKLLEATANAIDIIYAACRQCYSPEFAGDIAAGEISPEKKAAFVARIVSSGHASPLEHVKFTFAVEGVSRALTHQLVRHRIASYSQQSQRYVNADQFAFIIPPSIAAAPDLKADFVAIMDTARANYARLMKGLQKQGLTGEKANQDARFILPNAAETKIVITMNARELMHFFNVRCCTRAQWEIRDMAQAMLELCRTELPEVFKSAGARCEELGYCPEGARFCCGRYPIQAPPSS